MQILDGISVSKRKTEIVSLHPQFFVRKIFEEQNIIHLKWKVLQLTKNPNFSELFELDEKKIAEFPNLEKMANRQLQSLVNTFLTIRVNVQSFEFIEFHKSIP